MSNRKIDQLPQFTDDASGVHLVMNNASNTTTYTVTKETLLDGNNTFHGNQVISGSLSISGTTEFGGDLVPRTARGATLGTEERPFRDIFLQSASINIASDIPGGRGASISNADGNVTIQAAGFQLKTGSFVPFEISENARIIVRVPNIPAGDIGAFTIIGNASGSYQPVTNAGGLIHLTSNDGVSSRITSDAFGTTAFAAYVGRKARGTAANPLPVQSNDTLTRISAIGWTGPEYGFTMSSSLSTAPTSIDVIALENFTTSSFGTAYRLFNTPIGNTTRVLSAQIDSTGINIPTGSDFKIGGNSYTASLATTGSNTFNGNQTITGSLTLSSGSALRINNGFYVDGNRQFNYGQWASLETQTGSADTAYAMKLETSTGNNTGMYVGNNGSGLPTRIYLQNTGLYNIQFSSQLYTTANQACDFSVWFAMTGSNMANSNTDFTIEKINGGGYMVAALNLLTPISSGSYVELFWSKTTANGQLLAKGTQSAPARPATPSVIVTVTQIA
jgi:hypothetical protein